MDLLRYYVRVMRVALTHSLHAAHSVLLILVIVIGVIPYINPRIEILVDPHGWAPAALILAGIVTVRLLLAPFWIWREDQAQLLDLRTQLESKSRDEQRRAAKTAAIDEIAQEISWAVNNLVNPKPHPGNASDPETAIAAYGPPSSTHGALGSANNCKAATHSRKATEYTLMISVSCLSLTCGHTRS